MFYNLRLKKSNEFAFINVYDEYTFILNSKIVIAIIELLQEYKFRYNYKHQFLGDFLKNY